MAHEVRVVVSAASGRRICCSSMRKLRLGAGLRGDHRGCGPGAAHLPGMIAAKTVVPKVLGVPIPATALQGMDSLLSIVQDAPERGFSLGTLAIGAAGAANAGLLAVADACDY